MRSRSRVSCLIFAVLVGSSASAQERFDVPLRINMGGPELEDSLGRIWLGDGPGAGDPLDIRPNDLGGTNTIVDWCAPDPLSLEALGYSPFDGGDASIFSTIRWDDGTDGIDFHVALPIPDGDYLVNLFFQECCCEARHFQIEIEGEVVDEDVSFLDYGNEDADVFPASTVVGKLSFPDIAVEDGVLDIGFLPCPDPLCPGATDQNAIIDAIEVVSGEGCDNLGLDFNCVYDPEISAVGGRWTRLATAEGYRILKNGEVLETLGDGASEFEDPDASGSLEYVLQALDGDEPFADCICTVSAFACPGSLVCDVPEGSTEVALQWTPAGGIDLTGYELRRGGQVIASLGPDETAFEDEPGTRSASYTLTPITDPPDQCSELSCNVALPSLPFSLPVRINMGGDDTVDSLGRLWLGDRPCGQPENADPMDIRPDDFGGTRAICNWCPPEPASLEKYGLDPTDPGDAHIFTTIRWDEGGDGAEDFFVEIPIEADEVLVNLYFNECCCANRHFKISIQDQILNADVSFEDYDDVPGLAKLGRLTFPGIDTGDGVLRIGFLPCQDCPGATDFNAIVNAIEVLDSDCECDADDVARRCPELCPTGLTCEVDGGAVSGSWRPPTCVEVTGYELRKDGELLRTLPADASSFTDELTTRSAAYEVTPLPADGEEACAPMTCAAVNSDFGFEIPLRINMGGPALEDSRGRLWIGDGQGPGDTLDIRPDDAGGRNTVRDWCVGLSESVGDSMQSLGLDPSDPNDQSIFNTIRWDPGDDDADGFPGEREDFDGGDVDFRLEIPIPDGEYNIACYFTECCCLNRHFQIEMEGEIVADDVSAASYSASGELGRTGRLVFESIGVEDGALSLGLLPCGIFDCPEGGNFDAIIDAIEVLPTDLPILTCPRDLICVVKGPGEVLGRWTEGDGVEVSGYRVLRNGEEIATLPADATEFNDAAACSRVATYEVLPLSDDPDFLCPDLRLRCTVTHPDCPFDVPLRINMGGEQTVDSLGRLWLGDRPCALAPAEDPLNIRPLPDLGVVGGNQAICNWCAPVPESFEKLGLDASHPGDQHIFTTIRWDVGGDGFDDFFVEIPLNTDGLGDGFVDINLYFNECCCIARNFKISIQDEIVDDDVSYVDYDEVPGLGKAGVLSFEGIDVGDEILRIGFLPCPECPGTIDNNAIINAIEVLPSEGGAREDCDNGADDDGDNAVDCDDPDCADSPSCLPESICDDGNDNDGDNLTDCDDPDCLAIPGACPVVGERFVRGDSNSSGTIDLTDGVVTLNFLFIGGPPPACMDAADTDGNNQIVISDAVITFSYLFTGGARPVAPSPSATNYARQDCGADPDEDELVDCETPAAVCE